MTILVVEDDENKRVQLKRFLNEVLVDTTVEAERSLRGGIAYMRGLSPDLILLDMTLPNFDSGPEDSGGETHIFGGREFLRQMDRFDIVVAVIVVTQFEAFGNSGTAITLPDLDRELRAEHPQTYKGSVYYHAAIQGWRENLEAMLRSNIDVRYFRN